jgi:hypothetical protein
MLSEPALALSCSVYSYDVSVRVPQNVQKLPHLCVMNNVWGILKLSMNVFRIWHIQAACNIRIYGHHFLWSSYIRSEVRETCMRSECSGSTDDFGVRWGLFKRCPCSASYSRHVRWIINIYIYVLCEFISSLAWFFKTYCRYVTADNKQIVVYFIGYLSTAAVMGYPSGLWAQGHHNWDTIKGTPK